LPGAGVRGVGLAGAGARGVGLAGAGARGVRLPGARARGAGLTGADVSNSNSGSIVDNTGLVAVWSEPLAAAISALLRRKQMSQQDLAEQLETTGPILSHWMCGRGKGMLSVCVCAVLVLQISADRVCDRG
jgi:hypothetical protein